jgi:hypothetical protein
MGTKEPTFRKRKKKKQEDKREDAPHRGLPIADPETEVDTEYKASIACREDQAL